MGNITYKFEIQSTPRKDGCYPIYFRVTEDGYHKKMALGVHVQNPKNFNANARHGTWINTREPLGKVFNAKMEDTVLAFYNVERELTRRGELSKESVIINLKCDDSDSLIAYIDKKIEELMKRKRFASAESRKNLKKHLLRYSKNKDIRFKDMTASFIDQFELFLCTDNGAKKPLKNSSIHMIKKNWIIF